MKRLLFLILLVCVPQVHAVDALWDFGGENKQDGAWGYELAWGTSPGNYTNNLEILKSACQAGTFSGVPYDCRLSIPDNQLTVGTRYYVTVAAWAYSTDGTTKIYSVGNPTAEFVYREPGSSTEQPPAPPKSIRIRSTAP